MLLLAGQVYNVLQTSSGPDFTHYGCSNNDSYTYGVGPGTVVGRRHPHRRRRPAISNCHPSSFRSKILPSFRECFPFQFSLGWFLALLVV